MTTVEENEVVHAWQGVCLGGCMPVYLRENSMIVELEVVLELRLELRVRKVAEKGACVRQLTPPP
jgi:hypothetical protein